MVLQKQGATRGFAMGGKWGVHKGHSAKPQAIQRAVGGGHAFGAEAAKRGGGGGTGRGRGAGRGMGQAEEEESDVAKVCRTGWLVCMQGVGWVVGCTHVCKEKGGGGGVRDGGVEKLGVGGHTLMCKWVRVGRRVSKGGKMVHMGECAHG